jgi:hypothetical protein
MPAHLPEAHRTADQLRIVTAATAALVPVWSASVGVSKLPMPNPATEAILPASTPTDVRRGRHGLEEPLHRIHGAHGAPIMRKLMTGAVSAIIAFMLISPGTETPAQALAHHAVHANAEADAEVRDAFDDQVDPHPWAGRGGP